MKNIFFLFVFTILLQLHATTPLIVNGTTYDYPETGDTSWGDDATNWATAVTNSALYKDGGTFVLLDEVDFGATYGLKSSYYKSRGDTIASSGVLRMSKTDDITWRNNADDGNLELNIGTDDMLEFNAIDVVNVSSTQTLTNKTISGGTFSGSISFNVDPVIIGDGASATLSGSISIGHDALGEATKAIAIGDSASASGVRSICMGDACSSSGVDNIAIGADTVADGSYSIAIGKLSDASFNYGLAVGYDASSGSNSISIGDTATTTSSNSVAIGTDAQTSGGNSIAIGRAASSIGTSIAIGDAASSTHSASIAFGTGATTTAANQIRLGTATETVSIPGVLELASGTTANEISIDGALTGDSDDAIPTEKAVKAYADTVSSSAESYSDSVSATAVVTSNDYSDSLAATLTPLTLTTDGDILYYNSGHQRLAKGSDGTFLKLASGVPTWAAQGGSLVTVMAETTVGSVGDAGQLYAGHTYASDEGGQTDVAYYKFASGAGDDETGNYDLTFAGTHAASLGIMGDSFASSFTTNGYAYNGTLADTMGSSMVIDLWFKADDGQPAASEYLFQKANNSGGVDNMNISLRTDGRVSFKTTENSNTDNYIYSTTVLADGAAVWNHVLISWDSSGKKLYFNSVLESIDSSETTLMADGTDTDFAIGALASGANSFNGSIALFRYREFVVTQKDVDLAYSSAIDHTGAGFSGTNFFVWGQVKDAGNANFLSQINWGQLEIARTSTYLYMQGGAFGATDAITLFGRE